MGIFSGQSSLSPNVSELFPTENCYAAETVTERLTFPSHYLLRALVRALLRALVRALLRALAARSGARSAARFDVHRCALCCALCRALWCALCCVLCCALCCALQCAHCCARCCALLPGSFRHPLHAYNSFLMVPQWFWASKLAGNPVLYTAALDFLQPTILKLQFRNSICKGTVQLQ